MDKEILTLVMTPLRKIHTNAGFDVEVGKDIYGFLPIYKSLEKAKKNHPNLDDSLFIAVQEQLGRK